MSIYQGARLFEKTITGLESKNYTKARIKQDGEKYADIYPSHCFTRYKKEKSIVDFYFKNPLYDKKQGNIINNIFFETLGDQLFYYGITSTDEFVSPGSAFAKQKKINDIGIQIDNSRYYFIDETQKNYIEDSLEDSLNYPFSDFATAFLVASLCNKINGKSEKTYFVIINQAHIPIAYRTPEFLGTVYITSYSNEIEQLLVNNDPENYGELSLFWELESSKAKLLFSGIDTWETRLYCNCNLHISNLYLGLQDISGYGLNSGEGTWIIAQNHNLTMGQNLEMIAGNQLEHKSYIYDQADFPISALKLYILGGYEYSRDDTLLPTTMKKSNIRIESGEYWFVGGWNKKYNPSTSIVTSYKTQQFMRSEDESGDSITFYIGNKLDKNDIETVSNNNYVKINRLVGFSTGPQLLSAKSSVNIVFLNNFFIRVLHPFNQNLIEHYYNKKYFVAHINFDIGISIDQLNSNFFYAEKYGESFYYPSTIVYNTIDSAEIPIKGIIYSDSLEIRDKCASIQTENIVEILEEEKGEEA